MSSERKSKNEKWKQMFRQNYDVSIKKKQNVGQAFGNDKKKNVMWLGIDHSKDWRRFPIHTDCLMVTEYENDTNIGIKSNADDMKYKVTDSGNFTC